MAEDLNLKHFLAKLNVDNRIIKLIKKEVSLPNYIDDLNSVSDYWYPHPPCLIPLFLGHGASYKGIVNHFFCDRENTYVEYFLELGFLSEIARNADQFLTLIALRMIITKDELTDEIIEFCKLNNLEEYKAIDEFVVDYGDDPQEFDHLVYFKGNRPFKYLKTIDGYRGDFPSSLFILNTKKHLENAAFKEIAPIALLDQLEERAPWLTGKQSGKELFQNYLNNNQLKEAWLTLNGGGWLLSDVANALEQLKLKIKDELFTAVADHWIAGWKNSTFLDGNL